MTDPRAFDLMNVIIDGEATRAEEREFSALAQGNARLRGEFKRLKETSSLLSQLAALDPPKALMSSVMAKVAQTGNNRAPRSQLSGASHVNGLRSGVVRGATAAGKPFPVSRILDFIRFNKENFMSEIKRGFLVTTRSRVLAGGGVALAALVVVSMGINYPASLTNAAGTIVPAERYRSSQLTDANVQADGGSSTTKPTQVDAGAAGGAANAANNAAANAANNAAANAANAAAANAANNAAANAANNAAANAAANAANNAAANAANAAAANAANNAAANAANNAAANAANKAAANAANNAAANAANNAAANAANKAAANAANNAAANAANNAAANAANKAAANAANNAAANAANNAAANAANKAAANAANNAANAVKN
jgi:hypothetical protein